ncbi:hypothetical protein LA080_005194 [Diaporthe eres]|nr:hypothetical protein LA080_005194 [Diaporthe eres]
MIIDASNSAPRAADTPLPVKTPGIRRNTTLSVRVRAMLSPGQTRQQPGNACDECRKKKQRCDRQRPRCSSCVKTKAVCHFNEKRASPKAPNKSAPKTLDTNPAMSWVDAGELRDCSSSALWQSSNTEYEPPSSQEPNPDRETEELHLSDVTKADLYELLIFENIRDRLYATTRNMLDKLDLVEPYLDTRRVEPTQAWILVVFYELMKANYHCAWLSAGRVFRHVQMAELYSVDRAMKPCTAGIETDPIIAEEKRRCFWLAYCLDRIISVLETTPLTLGEEVIYTRLSCPDSEFHSGIITPQPLLSEVMASGEPRRYSNIAECVICATIYGRALLHQQTSIVEKAYSSPPNDYLERRQWIEGLLRARIQALRISLLYLWHIADLLLDKDGDQSLLLPLSARGLEAAQDLSQLAKDFELHGLFKAHILLPVPLFFGAYRIRSYLEMERFNLGYNEKAQLEKLVQDCLEVLQKLQTVNNLASRVLFQYYTRRFQPL